MNPSTEGAGPQGQDQQRTLLGFWLLGTRQGSVGCSWSGWCAGQSLVWIRTAEGLWPVDMEAPSSFPGENHTRLWLIQQHSLAGVGQQPSLSSGLF